MPIANPQAPRHTLSLPGLAPRPAPALPLAASGSGATTGGHRVPETVPAVQRPALAVSRRPEGHDPRALSKPYLERTLAALADIIGEVPPILTARCPLPLRIGVRAEFLAAYPAASPDAVSGWLRRWTATTQYRRALVAGGWRFDLAGHAVEEISAQASAHAAELLAREAARMAREAGR